MEIPDGPPFPVASTDVQNIDTKHANVYAYAYLNLLKNLTLTLGASGDFFQSDVVDRDQFNPKFGISWTPVPGTTIRGAAFRVMKRTLITNQTLEPTQVAGFNQFYDDINTTDSKKYGLAVDQKFSGSIYGGAEFSYRDLEVPFTSLETGVPEIKTVDWKEHLGRAYLYWTPHRWLAFKAEYLYEKFERSDKFSLGAQNIETQRVPLGIGFFHPSGISAMIRATYYNQKGDFETLAAERGTTVHGEDNFWLFDAAISYRLPKRYGFLSVGARNLFDQSFKYYDTDINNPTIQPKRLFFARVTLAF
jgi:hypothetical protein